MTTAFAVLFFLLPAMAAAQTPPGDQIEKALLAEDWSTLADDLLEAVTHDTQASPDPVLRWIKAHACLALNRNNESVSLFLSVADAEDRKKCRDWADAFAARHPTAPIAAYLRGDALARAEKFGEAIREYSRVIPSPDDSENYPLFATAKKAANPLIYNARGVAYALDGQLAKARLDFQVASETPMATGESGGEARYLADAFANIGALMIQQKEGAEGAKRALDRALAISPQFAFALYARGCIELVSVDDRARSTEQRFSEAEDFFRRALEQAGCARDLLVDTHATFLAESQGLTKEQLAKMLANQDLAGSLSTEYNTMLREFNETGNIGRETLNRFVTAFDRADRHEQAQYGTILTNTIINRPGLREAIEPGVHRGRILTGMAQGFLGAVNFPVELSANLAGAGALGGVVPGAAAGAAGAGSFETSVTVRPLQAPLDRIEQRQTSLAIIVNAIDQANPASIDRVDGVLADLSAAVWDSGHWPFRAMYGLSYQHTSE